MIRLHLLYGSLKKNKEKMVKRIRMKQGRKLFGCESFNGQIYIVGGKLQISNQATVTCSRYNIHTNTLEEIAILNKKRYGASL
mmetsp:Transcript_21551/g.21206  ORF Transcript_21551/g.21206 Transcript_21551/m.21206 type:complete len:83 (+) Transcript_21551:330-578(+)